MKPLRIKLQDECTAKQSRLDILEKDYALSYLLAGIAKQNQLNRSLVFKGGTALKKIFFGARQHWESNLGNLVTGLTECETVLAETKSLIKKVIFKE